MADRLWGCVIRTSTGGEALATSKGKVVVGLEPDVELQEFFGSMFRHVVPLPAPTELPTVRPYQLLERRDMESR